MELSRIEDATPQDTDRTYQREFRDGLWTEIEDSPPPLRVKLTCYRLLNVTTVILWAIPKAILSYRNQSIAATTVDLLAVLFGVM